MLNDTNTSVEDVKIPQNNEKVLSREISKIEEDFNDIPEVATISLLSIDNEYHQNVLKQSKISFLWALIFTFIVLLFNVAVVYFFFITHSNYLIAGTSIFDGIAGLIFYLYGRSSKQLTMFHGRLVALRILESTDSNGLTINGEDLAEILANSTQTKPYHRNSREKEIGTEKVNSRQVTKRKAK